MNGINLKFEKDRPFSTADLYSILNISTQIANIDNCMYSFIFERVSTLLLAALVFPDLSEEIQDAIADSLFDAWDKYVEEEVIDKLYLEHSQLLDEFSIILKTWWSDRQQYVTSMGAGIQGMFEGMSNELIADTAAQLDQDVTKSGVKKVLDIADKWGMNNEIPPMKEPNEPLPAEEESIFE